MQTFTLIVYLIGGMICLYIGAELLVVFASRLALSYGMTPLMTGLTVVAMSTSTPELAGSLMAQIQGGYSNIALGNIIGTNIANIGLILGVLALIKPMNVHRTVWTFEAPIALGLACLLWVIMLSCHISRGVGIVFCGLFVLYLLRHVWQVKGKEPPPDYHKPELSNPIRLVYFLLIILGTGVLAFGGYIFVEGAVELARRMNLSERVIGLTIVAVGTSLPEFAASFVALMKKLPDVALGNMFGSNVYNILMVLGIVAVVDPLTFSPKFLTQDMPLLVAFSLLIWLIIAFRKAVGRWAGLFLVLCYIGYLFLIF